MAESHSRTTVKSRLSRPLNGVIHQTQRRVSSEYPLPLLGDTMAAELGASYADSIVIAASLTPDLGKEMGTITHAQIPSESAQLASNWEHSTCDIGGVKFDSVQRTVIMLASAYSESAPAIGAALAANPSGAPNLGSGYVLADRQQVLSGTELEPVFRVERRNYIQKVTLGEVEVDPQTGIASRSETTLYYSGETVITGQTINQLMANPAHEHWATREDGFARSGTQLSECWYSVVDRKLVDLQPRWEKTTDRRRPAQFFCPKDTSESVVTTSDNAPGEPSAPTATDGQSVTVGKVGRIQKVTTITQGGNAQVLRGTDLMSEDGYIYPESQTLISPAAVPATRLAIGNDGRAVTYKNLDACNAVRIEGQGVSLEPETIKQAAKLFPQKFLDSEKVSITTTTSISSGEAEEASPDGKQSVEVRKKGLIHTKKVLTQTGEPKILKSLDFLEDDGNTYVSEQEALASGSLPVTPPTIQADGTIETYDAVDANTIIRAKRQGISILPGTTKEASRLVPERFIKDQKLTTTDEVECNVTGDPPNPNPVSKQSVRITQKGKIRRKRTVDQTGDTSPIIGTTFDERTGESFEETEEIVDNAQVVPAAVSASGELVSFDGIDARWSAKRRRQIVSTLEKTWTEVINYEWPPVLLSLDFVTWERKGGAGSVVYPLPRYKQGFTGPQAVQVRQWWQKAQPTPIIPISMIAEGIQFWSPLYKISIPPCLHFTIPLRCNIGSSDPDWEPQNFTQTFPATNVTDWPAQIVWTESKPYLGGFLMHRYTLNRPS
jgi:hypothetical protein